MNQVTITTVDALSRQCGECTLCCKLVPLRARDSHASTAAAMIEHGLLSLRDAADAMKAFDKPAGERCRYQRHTGCTVYERRPLACRIWTCRWLTSDDTDDMRRPDRAHYVVDVLPDFVTIVQNDSGERMNIEVVQVWIDPKHPDAHQDPALRRYLERRGKDGVAAIIRYSSKKAFTLFPPNMSSDGQWHEIHHGTIRPDHTPEELFEGVASARKVVLG